MRLLATLLLVVPLAAQRVLFLGDRGHHRPAARAQQLIPALAERGITVEFSDDLHSLRRPVLERYDALLLYANWTEITPQQEKALLGWVEDGGGFVAVHCASYCFLNSPRYLALVGARFQRHGFGRFRTRIETPEHEVMQGFQGFESEDETYEHELHASEGRTVLETRDGEPYTWVRAHEKGRVFYTAWGHDERTWGQREFHELLARGIRWAAAERKIAARRAQRSFSFEYVPGVLPNYEPGRPWGAQGAPHQQVQKPLAAEVSRGRLVLPRGLRAELFAAEPAIKKPLAIAFDARGRAWICESLDYPNERARDGNGRDSIRICEDTDGDGRADRFTVFADGLSLPTSLAFAHGGVVVTQPPHTLFLRDTDGDDRADEKRVLFTGWGTQDTHAGPSQLRAGLDNWLWCTVGYSGFRGEVGGRRHEFGSGILRFDARGQQLEFVRSTSNNTWGLGIAEDGEVFASTANGCPSVHVALRNQVYEPVHGWAAPVLSSIAGDPRLDAWVEPKQVDYHGRFTAAAGHALYTARLLPPDWWGKAFVCEPTGHLVATFALQAQGATFRATPDENLLASDDEWTAPIGAEVGPDGAVWVVDWYNAVVQHNPTPIGFRTGAGNAYETELRDKSHARIYRVLPAAGGAQAMPKLDPQQPGTLLAALRADNFLWRLHAQRLLVERGNTDVVPALQEMLRLDRPDATGLDAGAVHAVWTLHGLLAPIDAAALAHPSAAVRKNALQAAAADPRPWLADPDPRVRVQAWQALARGNDPQPIAEAVLAADLPPDADPALRDARIAAAARADFLVLPSLQVRSGEPGPDLLAGATWRPVTYSGRAEHARDGDALRIGSTAGADASWSATVTVRPERRYRLSAWVRTQGLQRGSGLGALLNLHELQRVGRSEARSGDSDWDELRSEFDSGARTSLQVNLLFGGWGRARGTAWFDRIELRELGPGADPLARTVARHFARRAAPQTITLLGRLPDADPGLVLLVLESLAEHWPRASVVPWTDADAVAVRGVLARLPARAQRLLLAWLERAGAGEGFRAERDAVAAGLRAAVSDAARPEAERLQAARDLLLLADTGENVAAIAGAPGLAAGAAVCLDLSRLDGAAAILLAGRPQVPAAAFLRRPAWASALLDALEQQRWGRASLTAADWAGLLAHPDAKVAERAGRLRQLAADREVVLQRLLPAAERDGDAARGRILYDGLCRACHRLGSEGGVLGPDLTGIGKRPAREILAEIVDPNRSLEDDYRLWSLELNDGRTLAGRTTARSATTWTLLDASGQSTVLARSEIKLATPLPHSAMPVGLLDSMLADDVAALLTFLRR
jgi:putative membrane-bound dehydrogenase-like protein